MDMFHFSQYTALASRNSMGSRYQEKLPVEDVPLLIAENRDIDIDLAMRDLQVEQSRVQVGNLLLEGTLILFVAHCDDVHSFTTNTIGNFGEVFNTASESQVSRFVSESLMFYGLPVHPNVSFVIAATYGGGASLPALCYFHRGFGNLKKFLMRCSGAEFGPSHSHSLSTQNLVYMALHIVRGVIHLHAHGIVHRDIATRTCIISEEMTVQLCDTGLSRDLFPQDYHCLGDNENRPVKWMALESIEKNEFTSASDAVKFLRFSCWRQMLLGLEPLSKISIRVLSPSPCTAHIYCHC
ncbi:unnamed protein product [Soboliphyme baturini]|uniref:Protein kinase domain-containing protein n=1 Tax=Soboliphyme baturini TaxID=241478 RepID=A0A183J1R1_9BILA|nr:unnamed protein product [Soboliphyme baturini]